MADPRALVVTQYATWLRAAPFGRARSIPGELARLLSLYPDARAEAESIMRSEGRAAPEPKPKRTPAVFRPMTEDEHELVLRLAECSFASGSFDKRFVRDVSHQAREAAPTITEKQAALLPTLAHRYRRQLGGCPVASCTTCRASRSPDPISGGML